MRRTMLGLLLLVCTSAIADSGSQRQVRIRELATIEGVRENALIGYGLVVGLHGTGDRQQTLFTTQMLANVMQRMGMQIPAQTVRVNNIAAVFVTASLPPFSRPGTAVDVTVSSIGDAKSLEGGTLLLTALRGEDGQTYALAQGAITTGGYSAGASGTNRQVNHPTVGRIAGGAFAEREVPLDLRTKSISLLLREADFGNAERVAARINTEFAKPIAHAVDGRRVEIDMNGYEAPALLARVQALSVDIVAPSRVVVNEKTGTVVMGRDVRLSAVSILHGNLTIDIATTYAVSQPAPLSNGETTVVPQSTLTTKDGPARRIELTEGATIEQLVNGLQSIGASARDVVSILQALKAAGALQAELEVL